MGVMDNRESSSSAQMRAQAVKAYLVSQGIEDKRIGTADKGAAEPIVACNDVKGKAVPGNTKLVQCLQPNRRVEVEVVGTRPVRRQAEKRPIRRKRD